MSHLIDPSVKPSLKEQFSWARAKKAYSAGVGGTVTGIAANVSVGGILADGKIDGPEVVSVIGFAVGGFVLGFIGAWLPAQPASAATKRDAV